jgi:glyoxylase-like metal-dependent hydrolase (beta-lactamase superfamily II)
MATIQTLLQGHSVATSEGSIAYCAVTLLRGERTTLVDVGHVGRRGVLLERLQASGLRPEDIDRVVLTHAHWDHCHNVDCFPNAEVLLHEHELEYTRAPHPEDWATPIWTQDILTRARIATVRDGDELEAGVRVLATPGHSRGSMTLLVDTPDGVAGLVGDALPTRASAGFLAPGRIFWDEEEGRRSARAIIDRCRTIFPGHDRPFRVANGGFSYIEPVHLQILNAPRDEEGQLLASFADATPGDGPIIERSARKAADPRPAHG